MSHPIPADPPDQAERPVPLERVPEGTADPAAWATDGTEPLDPPSGDDDAVLADRQAAERADRGSRAAGIGEPAPSGSTRESGYTTEITQGAAQPGPSTKEEDSS